MSAEAFRAVAADASQFLVLGCAVCAVLLVAARVQEWGLSLLQMGPLLPFERRLVQGLHVHLCMFVVIPSPGASTIRRQMPAMSNI